MDNSDLLEAMAERYGTEDGRDILTADGPVPIPERLLECVDEAQCARASAEQLALLRDTVSARCSRKRFPRTSCVVCGREALPAPRGRFAPEAPGSSAPGSSAGRFGGLLG